MENRQVHLDYQEDLEKRGRLGRHWTEDDLLVSPKRKIRCSTAFHR